MRDEEQRKITYQGTIAAVQPRSNVWRYRPDNRPHNHTGYNFFISVRLMEKNENSLLQFRKKQQEKLRFHIGDEITGTGWTKKYPEFEFADYYRAGRLKKCVAAEVVDDEKGTPRTVEVQALSVYDWRGCRMLGKKCQSGKCKICKWACMANVTIEYY